MRMMLLLSLLLLSVVMSHEPKKNKLKCNIPPNERQDCGFVGLDQKKCEEKGCCFLKNNHGSPWCFNGTKVEEDDSEDHQFPPKRDDEDEEWDRHHPEREDEEEDDVRPKRRNETHDHFPRHPKKEEEEEKDDETVGFHPKRRNETHDHQPRPPKRRDNETSHEHHRRRRDNETSIDHPKAEKIGAHPRTRKSKTTSDDE